MKRRLYSYQRWSSAVQAEGTTRERQSNSAQQYAEEHDFELVEIQDEGISAFRGVNAQRGALAAFIRAVEEGFIPADSVLYVESLDRISRDKILKALGLFNDLLELGITIITGSDRKTYTEESVNENSMDLLQSVLLFSRAHEESKTKQLRTNGNALVLIKRFQEEGLPVTIKSVGSHPWWIDATTDKYEPVRQHPIYWPIAQFAMNHFLEGKSAFRVNHLLNEEYPNGYKGKAWSIANVRKLRTNPAVYGLREITVGGIDYKLPGYFPALITEGQFYRLEEIRNTTKYLGKVSNGRTVKDKDGNTKVIAEKNNINLLAGMRVFRCGHCGSTMMAMVDDGKIRYLCEKGRGYNQGCKTWSMPGLLVEHTLMIVTALSYIQLQMKGQTENEDYSQQITSTETLIADISTRISRGTTLILNGLGHNEEVLKQLQDLDEQKKRLVLELEVLQRKQLLAKDDTFETLMMRFFEYSRFHVLQDPVHDHRNQLRNIIRNSISDVRAWKIDRKLYISFQMKGEELYYNFGPGDTPYEWNCELGELPSFSTGYEDTSVQVDEMRETLDDESMYKIGAYAHDVYVGGMARIRVAMDLLKANDYPELDSKLFWPRK